MFKELNRNQKGVLVLFVLAGAVFLKFPVLSRSLFSSAQSTISVHAQSPSTSVTPPPLSQECSVRCDTDKDGVITRADLSQYSGNQSEQPRIQFCTQQCPFEGNNPGSPSVSPSNSQPIQPVGDCSGSVAGTPDGTVDAKDIDQFRHELNKESINNAPATLACDFDKSGVVDIIDFTHYIRVGYALVASQTPSITPSPSVSPSITPSPSPSVTPLPSVTPDSTTNTSPSPVPSVATTP